jgi:WD40 repeat protein
MLEHMISIMGGFNDYRISGILTSRQEEITQCLEKLTVYVERISDKIFYVPYSVGVRDVNSSSQQYVNDLREIRAYLEPVQRAIGTEIISSDMIVMSEKMQNLLPKSPYEFLADISPVNLSSTLPQHGKMVPVLFSKDGIQYIGWQSREILLNKLGCQYDEFWVLNVLDSEECSTVLNQQATDTTHIPETLQGHQDWVNSVVFSPDGKIIASGSEDNSIKLWDAQTGKALRTLNKSWWRRGNNAAILSVAFSPDGRLLASGSEDNTIKFWDVNTGKLRKTLQGEDFWVKSITFSPDGRTVASEGDQIKLWDMETNKALFTLEGMRGVAFSPNGGLLASGGFNDIKLWDMKTGKAIHSFKRHADKISSVAFNPDGSILASGSEDQTIKLWDLKTGKGLGTLEGHTNSVSSIAFRPDGRALASSSSDKTIKLWELSTYEELDTLYGHDCLVTSMSFSPDGKTLASASEDNTIKVWH